MNSSDWNNLLTYQGQLLQSQNLMFNCLVALFGAVVSIGVIQIVLMVTLLVMGVFKK